MLFDLKPGDKVNFTNALGGGTVFKIDGETIVVEDDNGIVLHLTWKDVVPIFKPEKDLPVFRTEVKREEAPKRKDSSAIAAKPAAEPFNWEAKPSIKKVKDKSAGIKNKDAQTTDRKEIQSDEETGTPEIDLHLHEILDDESGMDDYDKLQYQLNYMRKELRRLNQLHKQEAVIIHGVGKGRLRDEVRTALSELPFILDFFDASFKKYGAGATQVVLGRGADAR